MTHGAGCPGEPPCDVRGLAPLLDSWVHEEQRIPLGGISLIRQLPAEIAGPLAGHLVTPVIYHGDLAPWNVKVARGAWTVLDWERGGATGVPAWDWFHFVIQPALLVRRLPPEQVFERVAGLWRSAAFQRYAATAEIAEFPRELLRGYLLYMLEVVRPADGLAELRALHALALKPPR